MKRLFCALLTLPLLAACSDVRETVGLGRNNPDEFQVVKNPPLAMPPEFTLRPPDPSARRPAGEATPAVRAATAVGAPIEVEDATSTGVSVFLSKAGAADAKSDIRQTLDTENEGVVVKDRDFVEKLMIWEDQTRPDPAVDAAAESTRIETEKTPDGFITGGGVKYEQPKRKAPLEGLFD